MPPAHDAPWEHPDWYDLHDTAWAAGPEREPEHYRELVLALPPLGSDSGTDGSDHLVDIGAGTGKLAALIAQAYGQLGRITLIEPNLAKLERARRRVAALLPQASIEAVCQPVGQGAALPVAGASLATIGSVLMPIMELGGGTLSQGLCWVRRALAEVRALLGPGGWLYDLETLAAPWARGGPDDPVRRLHMAELMAELERAGLEQVECAYRFRDRVIVRARAPR